MPRDFGLYAMCCCEVYGGRVLTNMAIGFHWNHEKHHHFQDDRGRVFLGLDHLSPVIARGQSNIHKFRFHLDDVSAAIRAFTRSWSTGLAGWPFFLTAVPTIAPFANWDSDMIESMSIPLPITKGVLPLADRVFSRSSLSIACPVAAPLIITASASPR